MHENPERARSPRFGIRGSVEKNLSPPFFNTHIAVRGWFLHPPFGLYHHPLLLPFLLGCLCIPPVFSDAASHIIFPSLFFLFFLLLPPSILKEERRCNFHAMPTIYEPQNKEITVFAIFHHRPNVGDTISTRFNKYWKYLSNLLD